MSWRREIRLGWRDEGGNEDGLRLNLFECRQVETKMLTLSAGVLTEQRYGIIIGLIVAAWRIAGASMARPRHEPQDEKKIPGWQMRVWWTGNLDST